MHLLKFYTPNSNVHLRWRASNAWNNWRRGFRFNRSWAPQQKL